MKSYKSVILFFGDNICILYEFYKKYYLLNTFLAEYILIIYINIYIYIYICIYIDIYI